MRTAILLYDELTALDAIGPYEVFARIPDNDVIFVGKKRGEIRTDSRMLGLFADAELVEIDSAEIVVVPGGPGQTALMDDHEVHDWLRDIDKQTTWTATVCTGALVLAAAGLLTGRQATTHWLARQELAKFGAISNTNRVVFDGKYVSAAGVSAGLDMALALTEKIAGKQPAQRIQLMIEYDPQPPFDAGSPEKAPDEIVRSLRASSRFSRPSD